MAGRCGASMGGMKHRPITLATALAFSALLAACASPTLSAPEQARLNSLLPADVLLLGEQHDAPEHQRLQRQVVRHLAARGELAAVAMEMAEQGRSTAGLPPDASQEQVRSALAWQQAGWPWERYGPVVMAAVRAGVPVLGANLPRARMREAMRDEALDTRLPPATLAAQRERIRTGHCNALPESQIAPMTRVQIARDMAMARSAEAAAQTGRTVLLIAGNGHVRRDAGVPHFLPAHLNTRVLSAQAGEPSTDQASALHPQDLRWPTPAVPPRDHCAAFRAKTSS